MYTDKLLYHITHLNNVDSIVSSGVLCSHIRVAEEEIKYSDVANPEIQSRRKQTVIPCGAGGLLHDYVPFYFAPRSPMLYSLKMNAYEQSDIVYFMMNIDSVLKNSLDFVFTDAHAIRWLTNFYTNLQDLSNVDWEIMSEQHWSDTDTDLNRKARRQAEFLIHNIVPLSACIGFAVYDERAKHKVEGILHECNVSLPVGIRPSFYF